MQEKASSKFSSRYSLGNLRCTAYICTTVIQLGILPRSNDTSAARNWGRIWKDTERSLQNTLLFDWDSHLCGPSDYRRACQQMETLIRTGERKSSNRCAERDAPRAGWLTNAWR